MGDELGDELGDFDLDNDDVFGAGDEGAPTDPEADNIPPWASAIVCLVIVLVVYASAVVAAEGEDKLPALVLWEASLKSLAAGLLPSKSVVRDRYAVDHDWGLAEETILLQGDGEPALVALRKEIAAARNGRTILETSPRGDHQRNGAAERGVARRGVDASTRLHNKGAEMRANRVRERDAARKREIAGCSFTPRMATRARSASPAPRGRDAHSAAARLRSLGQERNSGVCSESWCFGRGVAREWVTLYGPV